LICFTACLFVFVFTPRGARMEKRLLWFDALGLSVFAVIGTEIALKGGVVPYIAIVMGVITAVGGGIVRDVLCREIPLIFRKEIYAMAAAVGATAYVLLEGTLINSTLVLLFSLTAAFLMRALAIIYRVRLPTYHHVAHKKPSVSYLNKTRHHDRKDSA